MPPKRKRGGKVSNGSKTTKRDTDVKIYDVENTETEVHLPKEELEVGSKEEVEYLVEDEIMQEDIINEIEIQDGIMEGVADESKLASEGADHQLNKILKKRRFKSKIKIQCKQCSKIFKYRNNYKAHLENEHSNLPTSVSCSQCHVRCPNKKALEEHIENVHKRPTFKCPNCKSEFVRHAHVLRHMAQKGCCGGKVTTYPCEICCAQFTRKDNLMVHLRLQHITSRKFQCKESHCAFSTSTFSKLLIHKQKYHSDGQVQQYECDYCGKVVTSRAAICKHLEIHGDKKFACDVCGYSTHTIEVMRRHVLTHVRDKPYKCDMCERSFIQRSQLTKHQDKHFYKKCKICALPFTSKQKLTEHMALIHKKVYTRPEGADDDYSCDVCNKSFPSEVMMRKHLQSHTLERPRRCMYCVVARAYVRGEMLVKHVRKAHPHLFNDHLAHVRQVLNRKVPDKGRVTKPELDAVLNVLDAEAERILQGYGEGVLYGGIQEPAEPEGTAAEPEAKKEGPQISESPLMSENELSENLSKLLVQLIDKDLLECFGWPAADVDEVLEKVIEHCGAKPASRQLWSRVQRLRENAKHLFLYVIDDKTIARMLDSHTIDQIVKHILAQVTDDDDDVIIPQDGAKKVVEKILPVE